MTNIPPEVLTAANEKSRRLKELLLAPEILILPGAFNVLSALLYGFFESRCTRLREKAAPIVAGLFSRD